MRDLKELLEDLGDRPMPDRWDAIQRRPVSAMSDPRPSRAGAYATAALVALLAVAVIAWLSPLGSGGPQPATPGAPPAWLVDQAYQWAYTNGDITPDGAWWTTSDATTITPSPGAPTGQSRYLVTLQGDFIANSAPVPFGAEAPRGHWLYVTFDPATHDSLDWGVGNEPVDVSSMQAFDIPPASQAFAADTGWSVAVPPGWHAVAVDQKDPAAHQVVIANFDPSSLVYAPEPVPLATTIGFPANGVAALVAREPVDLPGFGPVSAPVSLPNDAERSSGADGSTLQIVVVRGPDAVYSIAVRNGRNASQIDIDAMDQVFASLVFEAR
jgi:hypothetical protein